jgi:hemoglobin/transferrin/lactoferrin receptor protein
MSCYYTYIDGMIVRTPTGRTIDGDIEVTKKNAGEGYVTGAELSTRFAVNADWSGWVSGSIMNGRVDGYPTSDTESEEEYISRLMPPTAEIGVRWQPAGADYWCECSGNMADKADKLSASDKRDTQRIPEGGTPGYAVWHVRAGTRVTPWMTVSVAVENIFDKDYRIHGSGVNEPGRNVILVAECDF